jgi:hypothetical protein
LGRPGVHRRHRAPPGANSAAHRRFGRKSARRRRRRDAAHIEHVAGLGADIIVSGSAIFDGRDAVANAAFMLDRIREAGGRAAMAAGRGGRG